VGVFDATHTQQECFDLAGVVVADGQDHSWFGDAVVGRVFTDHGIGEQVLDLADACLSRGVIRDEVVVVVHEVFGDFDVGT
jgi:hypothetical protein